MMKKARIIGSCVGLYFLIYWGITWRLSFRATHSDPYQNCITIDKYIDQAEKYHTREFVTYYNQQYLDRTKKLQAARVEKAPIDKDQIFNPFSPHWDFRDFERFGWKNNTTLASLASGVKSSIVTRSQLFKLIPPPNHTKMIQDFGRKEDKTPNCIDGRISSNPVFYSSDYFRKHKNKIDFIDGKAFDQWYRIDWFNGLDNRLRRFKELESLEGRRCINDAPLWDFWTNSRCVAEIFNMRDLFVQDVFLNLDRKWLNF